MKRISKSELMKFRRIDLLQCLDQMLDVMVHTKDASELQLKMLVTLQRFNLVQEGDKRIIDL